MDFLTNNIIKIYDSNTLDSEILEYNEKLVDLELDRIIYDYINRYNEITEKRTCYDLFFGEFIFIKFNNTKYINIFGIFVIPEYRRKGIMRKFIQKIIDRSKKSVTIQAVMSKTMIDFLDKFRYNGSKFIIINGIYTFRKK